MNIKILGLGVFVCILNGCMTTSTQNTYSALAQMSNNLEQCKNSGYIDSTTYNKGKLYIEKTQKGLPNNSLRIGNYTPSINNFTLSKQACENFGQKMSVRFDENNTLIL